jgi:hypothetical protein
VPRVVFKLVSQPVSLIDRICQVQYLGAMRQVKVRGTREKECSPSAYGGTKSIGEAGQVM